jgi:hypothetical protein
VVENEAVESKAVASSDRVLQDVEHHPALSVGVAHDEPIEHEQDSPDLIEQIAELADLLRQFARNCSNTASMVGKDHERVYLHAEKSMFRCVDELKRFLNEYR